MYGILHIASDFLLPPSDPAGAAFHTKTNQYSCESESSVVDLTDDADNMTVNIKSQCDQIHNLCALPLSVWCSIGMHGGIVRLLPCVSSFSMGCIFICVCLAWNLSFCLLCPSLVFHGTALLERDKRFSEALHYYQILLGCCGRVCPLGHQSIEKAEPHAHGTGYKKLDMFDSGAVMLGEVGIIGWQWFINTFEKGQICIYFNDVYMLHVC